MMKEKGTLLNNIWLRFTLKSNKARTSPFSLFHYLQTLSVARPRVLHFAEYINIFSYVYLPIYILT